MHKYVGEETLYIKTNCVCQTPMLNMATVQDNFS